MSAVLSRTATAGVNFPSVNHVLMRGLLNTAKQNAPFFAPAMPGMLGKNNGTMSVKWERYENFNPVTTPLAELGTPLALPTRNAVSPTITPITADMAKYGNPIYYTEEMELFTVNTRAANHAMMLGENAGRSLNAIMEAVYSAGLTNVRLGGGVGGAASIVTSMSVNDMNAAVSELNTQDAMKFKPMATGADRQGTLPIREAYMGICHTYVEQDIRDLAGFTPVERYGNAQGIMPGEFGSVAGVRWVSTSLSTMVEADAATTSAAGFRGSGATQNDIFDSYIVGREAIGSVGLGEKHTEEIYKTGKKLPTVQLIQNPLGSAGAADPFAEVGSVAWKAWFVGKVLNANWGWKLRTLAKTY